MLSFPLSTALVTLTFLLGITTSVQVDFCSIINCGTGRQAQWTWSDKYVCMTVTKYYQGSNCDTWQWVFANTGTEDWGSQPFEAQKYGLKNRFSIIKGHASHKCVDNHCNPLIIILKNSSLHDSGTYILGAYVSGTDPLGRFLIKIDNPVTNTSHSPAHTPVTPTSGSDFSSVKIMNISTLSSTFSIETGYGDQNRWLQWVLYSSHEGNYTCFSSNYSSPFRGTNVGHIPSSFCSQTFQVNSTSFNSTLSLFLLTQSTPRADIWWMCSTLKLLDILPPIWTGTCTLTQLVMPFHLLPLNSPRVSSSSGRRRRPLSADPSTFSLHGPGVYFDSIGVPCGVLDKFQARDQVAAGFESIFPQVTINKNNVDWINYLYYNQQRFLNFTKDAIEGIYEQLDRTSLMTWQNRLALDMLLAEKGGVCAMFGDACCTYIPNNTAPDGSITRALAGLTALSKELSTNSGITNPWDQWFASSFGSWGQWIRSVFISLVVTFCLLLLVGCCIIPLFRLEKTEKEPRRPRPIWALADGHTISTSVLF
uniref:Uncharacterized protein n=1 Tax=Erpetoichthys calabaricus TaxID=27687 RepID=A0A8C4XGV4_ERPCA